ncbi:3-keto-disaccharide hydrolase [Sediminibacterium soli]|uniref:3-keto-disaccharide hydrolase n=1 Tax=Sediminibacterium soli TaxID=2698829 RepID=UPI001F1CE218|nr:DUF1080 domain-containing protein [Sediminibacterium soli]
MKKILLAGCSLFFTLMLNAQRDLSPVEGRWDITVQKEGKELPSWLEISHSGNSTLVGRFVYAFGSARPVSHIKSAGGKYRFSIPVQWEPAGQDMEFEFTHTGDRLNGTLVFSDGKQYEWTAERAPSLRRKGEPVWGTPVILFNGKNLAGWHAAGPNNQWLAEKGILRSPKSGSNLVSDRTFTDFKLHIEFRYPKGSNSGVYLRGRYEVQVEDSKGEEPLVDRFSAIYGFLAPNEMTAKSPGEWQSYDITLVGRLVTVVANGKKVICEQVIPGITGGALNSREGEPGPILIQGDHGAVEYRNIVITPVK